jgi:hypothetical protein
MARRKAVQQAVQPEPEPDDALTSPAALAALDTAPEPPRRRRGIFIPFDDSGRVDKTRLKDPEKAKAAARELVGTAEEQAADRQAKVDAMRPLVYPIVSILFAVEAQLVKRSIQDETLRKRVADLWSVGPDDLAVLESPTAEVLAKHSGAMGQWKEEIHLVLALMLVHQKKLATLKEYKDGAKAATAQ